MFIFRKILLLVLALAIGIGAYLAYRLTTNPPAIEIGGGYTIVKTAAVEPVAEGKIGDTVIGQTDISEFNMLDAQGNVKCRFGFKKLVHSQGMEWQLDEPYVNIYDGKYNCSVTSVSGLIRIEMIAGKPVPVSAKLMDNVVIDFKTKEAGRDCKINLERLNYEIERNSFESDGKVVLSGNDIEMSGTGMTLIYNPDNNRIELLKIPDIDFIKITEKRLAAQQEEPSSESVISQSAKSGGVEKTTPQSAAVESGVYYEFILDNNVTVVTEKEKINASTVRISNILWKDNQQPQEQPQKDLSAHKQKDKSDTNTAQSKDGFEFWQPEGGKSQEPQVAKQEYQTVTKMYITSEGGLVLRPHEKQKAGSRQTLDLIGEPVVIAAEQFEAASPYLWYAMEERSLRLYSQGKGKVSLKTADGKGALEADESIYWSDAEQTATVKGPGTVLLKGGQQSQYPDSTLKFADTIVMKMNGTDIKNIRIGGGFDADISGDEKAKISSRNAYLTFNPSNALSAISLSDSVNVSSPQGGVAADLVDITFKEAADGKPAPDIAIAQGKAKLLGGEAAQGYHPVLNADKITYSFNDQSAVAQGSIQLSFTLPAPGEEGRSVPMVINADKEVVYKAGSGYIEFNDNVRGIIRNEHQDFSRQSEFKCDKMKVYLDNSTADASSPGSLKRIELEGQKVVFEDKRFKPLELLSLVNLECDGFDYDIENGLMTARGPGSIKVNNRDVKGSSSDKEISLAGPCYALIENFSILTIDTNARRITADSDSQMVHVGYIPILPDGKTGTERLVDAGKFVIDYQQQQDGRAKITAVNAAGKVHYYEPDKYQLIGDSFNYDSNTSMIVISGTPGNPCVLNSTLVEGIEYNVLTGSIKSTISGVSNIPANR